MIFSIQSSKFIEKKLLESHVVQRNYRKLGNAENGRNSLPRKEHTIHELLSSSKWLALKA